MRFHKLTITSVFVLLTSLLAQKTSDIDPNVAASTISNLLGKAQVSGSLVYYGCDSIGHGSFFPAFQTPKNSSASVLQLVREMFADDPKIRVTQEPSTGNIRIVATDVAQDLLNVRILHISFVRDTYPIDNPIEAMFVILDAPEVREFKKSENTDLLSPTAISILKSRNSPHISGDLYNVTVSQALDYILQTYPGFWTYAVCQTETGGRTVRVNFFPIAQVAVLTSH